MQVTGMGGGAMGYKYSGALDALKHILRTEGFLGLYQGIWPNLRESICCFVPSFF
jgi:solute carrier family 25 phosphate transporter 23/24/25/41